MENEAVSGARSSEKWIQGLNPSMPVDEAARHVLGLRLRAVADAVKKARKRDQLEPSLVHQLRVATRRADAAMQAFESLTDDALAKRVSKRLKKIRRAAGNVRMCDVHLGELRRLRTLRGDPLQRAAFEHALMHASSERQESARQLERVAERWGGKSWRGAINDVVHAIPSTRQSTESPQVREGRTLKSFADEGLAGLAGQFIAATQNDLTSPEKLHELRIDGKHVRYALEIFAECMDEAFTDDLYGQLAGLQERLGAINDSHEIADRLARYSQELGSALEGESAESTGSSSTLCAQLDVLATELREQSQSAHQQFLDWWKDGQKQRFIDALNRLTEQTAEPSTLNAGSPSSNGADMAVEVESHSIQGFIANPQAQHT